MLSIKRITGGNKTSSSEIVTHLLDILDGMHIEYKQCELCNWIDLNEELWVNCATCNEPICEACQNYNYLDMIDTTYTDIIYKCDQCE